MDYNYTSKTNGNSGGSLIFTFQLIDFSGQSNNTQSFGQWLLQYPCASDKQCIIVMCCMVALVFFMCLMIPVLVWCCTRRVCCRRNTKSKYKLANKQEEDVEALAYNPTPKPIVLAPPSKPRRIVRELNNCRTIQEAIDQVDRDLAVQLRGTIMFITSGAGVNNGDELLVRNAVEDHLDRRGLRHWREPESPTKIVAFISL